MCVSSLSNVYISPTSGIRAHGGVGQKVARLSRFLLQLEQEWGVYLAPFCKWSRDEPLSHFEWGQYFAQGKPIKVYTNYLGKKANK